MNSLQQTSQRFNHPVISSSAILSTLDLIDYSVCYHKKQAEDLAQLARWHQARADALAAERRTLAADVANVLTQAEELLR